MSIVQITTDVAGQINVNPRRVKIIATDNLATVTTAGYLNAKNLMGFALYATDVIDMWYGYVSATSPGTYEVFTPSIAPATNVITLVQWANPGDVLLPVVGNDFANFNGATGQIKDAGYSPSDPVKTKVVMANGAVILNHIGTFKDTAGTLGNDAATAINGGNIQAGLSGTAGTLASFPATAARGSLVLQAVANTGNTLVTISNALHGQASVYSIPDSGAATANFIISALTGTQHITVGNLQIDAGNLLAGSSGNAGTVSSFPTTAARGSLVLAAVANTGNTNTTISNAAMAQASVISIPDPGAATSNFVLSQSNLATNNVAFTKVITATAAALATAGKVNIAVHPSATSQFAVIDLKVLNSTGLSGGGGDRLLAITDGTLGFNNAGITAALLGTPVFTVWGGAGNPVANGTSQVSTAGADIYFQYIGGATDYAAGSVQLAVTLVQVTA